jgi:AhpD family alkylhydroperoxidase
MTTAFTVHTLESAPEAAKAKLAQVEKAWGFLPKLHSMMAESPETLEAYDVLFALVGKTSLTPAEQQVVFIAVSVLHGCEYCTMGHTYLGRMAKLDENAIQALREGKPIPDAKLEALRSFTEIVVRERGFASDSALDAFMRAGYTKKNVLEVVTVIATKTISNYVNHLTHTPKESVMSSSDLAWVSPRNRIQAA